MRAAHLRAVVVRDRALMQRKKASLENGRVTRGSNPVGGQRRIVGANGYVQAPHKIRTGSSSDRVHGSIRISLQHALTVWVLRVEARSLSTHVGGLFTWQGER